MSRKQPETYLKNQIRQALQLAGWFVVPIRQSLGSYPGLPDLWCIKQIASDEAWEIWLEIKVKGRKMSEAQAEFIKKVNLRYGHAYCVSSLEDLKEIGMIDNLKL